MSSHNSFSTFTERALINTDSFAIAFREVVAENRHRTGNLLIVAYLCMMLTVAEFC